MLTHPGNRLLQAFGCPGIGAYKGYMLNPDTTLFALDFIVFNLNPGSPPMKEEVFDPPCLSAFRRCLLVTNRTEVIMLTIPFKIKVYLYRFLRVRNLLEFIPCITTVRLIIE
jgi:hypothetical protein